jgi:hydroxyacylglutathione hydrolase
LKTFTTKHGYQVTQVIGGRSNVFLISNQKQSLLVDTSWKYARKELYKKLRRLAKDHLTGLILTHAHFDHAENAAWIKEQFNPKVFVHEAEAEYLSLGENLLPAGTTWLTRLPMALLGPRLSSYFNYPPLQADICVGERYDMKSIGFGVALLHTPGHTRGSMSVIVDDEIAVVGDAMFGIFPGRVFPPFANDVPQMVRSWRKLLDTGCKIFLPSHGFPRDRDILLREYENMKGK